MAFFTDRLKMWQRKEMPAWPRFFRWRVVIPSGPSAVEFLLFLMASATASGVKGVKLLSSL